MSGLVVVPVTAPLVLSVTSTTADRNDHKGRDNRESKYSHDDFLSAKHYSMLEASQVMA